MAKNNNKVHPNNIYDDLKRHQLIQLLLERDRQITELKLRTIEDFIAEKIDQRVIWD